MAFPLRTRTRGRPSRNAGVVNVAAAPSFNPLTSWTTDPVHGVWASDPLWTPPADGGAVSSWRNGGSVGTPNFTQATGTKQPLYRASTAAYNNQPTVEADAVDDFLASNFADLTQPFWIVLVGNLKATTGTKYLCDAFSTQSGILYNNSGVKFAAYGGAAGATSQNTDTSPHLHRVKFNGASSTYRIDEASVFSGNLGALGLDGATLFARATGAAVGAQHFHYYAIFTTDPTAQAEWADFLTYVETEVGIPLA